MSTLIALSTPRKQRDGRYTWQVPSGWAQGRTCFGGLVMATLVRALEDSPDAKAPLRALQVALCGPVTPGTARVEVETLRAGRRLSTLSARLSQDDVVRTNAVAFFGERRVPEDDPEGTWRYLSAPEMPPWREMPVAPLQPPINPEFTPHFAFRPMGALPFSGVEARDATGWIRARSPGAKRDAAFIAAHADAWWPAMISGFTAPRPVASVAITLEILGDFEGLDPDAPLFHVGRAPASVEGFVVELRELWGEDGRLIALNQQTQVLIR